MSIISALPRLLAGVNRPGDFYASGQFEWRAPAISVEGVGPIALPLLEEQAKKLIGAAQFAPFGRREATLVDPAVRNGWQIDSDRVTIVGGRWREALDGVVARAAEGLSVDGAVEAVFYKLLIYEPGGFFRDHRDTEKQPGMFATLIVAPPGLHKGGELIVRHAGREAKLELQSDDPAEAAFAAFYADCPHEVRPVEEGYRLVLVYNLVRSGKRPAPPNYSREGSELSRALEQWRVADDLPRKVVYLLEHAYSPAELSFSTLKGADQAAARTLLAAANEAGCDLHLALLTVSESGAAEYSGSGRWDREDELEAGEVFSRSVELADWRTSSDAAADIPSLDVAEDELSPAGAIDDVEPDEEYFGEHTGNAGASFERTYRRAALVLWPRERVFELIADNAPEAALGMLKRRVEGASNADDRAFALKFAAAISAKLAAQPTEADTYLPYERRDAARLLEQQRKLDDIAGLETNLAKVLPRHGFAVDDVDAVFAALSRIAESKRGRIVERLFVGAASTSFPGAAKLLRRLAEDGASGDLKPAAAHLAACVGARPADEPRWRRRRPDPVAIGDALAALRRIDETATAQMVERMLADRGEFSFDETLAPALCRLAEQGETLTISPAIERLRLAALAHLRARAGEPLAAPPDWRRDAKLGCKCEVCTPFAAFLGDPGAEQYTLRAAGYARDHLEQAARAANSDVDFETVRKGRPFSLVATKNQASYHRRVAQRKLDLQTIARLAPDGA